MTVPLLAAANAELKAGAAVLAVAPEEVEASDVEAAAPEVARLHVVARELVAARSIVEATLARRLDGGIYEGDGFVLRSHWSADRTEWDDTALVSRIDQQLLRLALYDEDGERYPGADEATAERVIAAVHALINIKGRTVRMTPLKKWGIDPNHYATVSGGIATLEVIL